MIASAFMSTVARPGLSILRVAATALLVLTMMCAAAFAQAGKRVALVVGNSAYEHAPKLANPANDATDIAIELKALGFTVVEGVDLTNRGMRDKIREFANELRGAEVGMIYYAGHGLQVNGRNYLAPVDAKLDFESDLDFETIPLEFVQRQMEREVRTVLLFLDACRDNPLTRSFRAASRSNGAGKGLAEVKSAAGTLIAFSTDPNNVALDGTGRNSPFTKALVRNISRKGVEIQTMMTDVRQQVYEETNEAQTPWINSSLLGRFYFAPDAQSASTDQKVASVDSKTETSTDSSQSSSAALSQVQIEALAWETVKDSTNVEELETFLTEYGSGFYGKLARLRLRTLKESQATETKAVAAQTEAVKEEPKAVAETPVKAEEPAKQEQVASLEQPKAEGTRKIEAPQADPREVALGIQKELVRLSCNPGKPDGIWGKRSQGALDTLRRAAKLELASLEPTSDLLQQLKDHSGTGCPAVVVKTCPAGQKLGRKGQCFTPRVEASAPAQQQQSRSTRRQQAAAPQEQFQQEDQQFQQDPSFGQPVFQQQPVIVQQHQQPVFQPQPQPHDNGLGIGLTIGGNIACRLIGC